MKRNIKKDKEHSVLSRKNLFQTALAGVAALATASRTELLAAPLKKRKMAMVIDLQQCTGCGACSMACKLENNVSGGIRWSDHLVETSGTFPNVRYVNLPTLCNHCDNAPCVNKCPTGAMYKDPETNLTLHDTEKCIGCTACGIACPYNAISFNKEQPHKEWREGNALIKGCTASGPDITRKVKGTVIPYYNPERAKTYPGIRPQGVVEKCTLCDHRLKEGLQPYCVDACPSDARIVGDLSDSHSVVSRLLRKFRPFRRKEHMRTRPNVYYIKGFNPGKSLTNEN